MVKFVKTSFLKSGPTIERANMHDQIYAKTIKYENIMQPSVLFNNDKASDLHVEKFPAG